MGKWRLSLDAILSRQIQHLTRPASALPPMVVPCFSRTAVRPGPSLTGAQERYAASSRMHLPVGAVVAGLEKSLSTKATAKTPALFRPVRPSRMFFNPPPRKPHPHPPGAKEFFLGRVFVLGKKRAQKSFPDAKTINRGKQTTAGAREEVGA